MPGLPIVKMTLYKHGVGFFTRHGEQPGETVGLSFRKEEMNDVLKSLTAVAAGGQVLGVDYQTPEDKAELLERSSIRLSDAASLRDLLRDARGRRVTVAAREREVSGVLIGVDLPGEREPMETTLASLFLPETREVVAFPLGSITRVTLDDDRAAADLTYFLETSLTEESKRAVTVRLSPGSESVDLSYIAPSPVWRVSYRLVVDAASAEHPERNQAEHSERNAAKHPERNQAEHSERNAAEHPERNQAEHSERNAAEHPERNQAEHSERNAAEHPERNGLLQQGVKSKDAQRALLQGWALFDNTLDEDLENVEVSFVAGMPVSFIYDLYTPFTPERPTVREESRGVAAPVEFEAAMAPAPKAARAGARTAQNYAREDLEVPSFLRRSVSAADVAASSTIAATGKAQGEYFSYVVANPLTVRRGRSAMAPILQSELAAEKERLYNGQKQPRNPVIALRFKNTTDLTLERGPVTVLEAGEYAGEAMLPFTANESEIYIAYAVDLGITVTEDHRAERKLERVKIQEGYLMMQEWDIRATKYELRNRNKEAGRVLIEHPVLSEYETFDSPEPAAKTAEHYRYAVETAPGDVALLRVKQRRQVWRREEIGNQSLDQLAQWLRGKALDEPTYNRLRDILRLYDQIKEREFEIQKNGVARQRVLEQQKTIQGNLAALKETGEEGELRRRYARTLQEQEDRLAALDRADEDLRKANEGTRQEIQEAVHSL